MNYPKNIVPKSTVPKGTYNVKITDAYPGVSAAGNEMIVLELEVIPDGVTFKHYLVAVGGGRANIEAFFAAIGRELQPGQNIDPNTLIGCEPCAELGTRLYKGAQQNVIDIWLPLSKAVSVVQAV